MLLWSPCWPGALHPTCEPLLIKEHCSLWKNESVSGERGNVPTLSWALMKLPSLRGREWMLHLPLSSQHFYGLFNSILNADMHLCKCDILPPEPSIFINPMSCILSSVEIECFKTNQCVLVSYWINRIQNGPYKEVAVLTM